MQLSFKMVVGKTKIFKQTSLKMACLSCQGISISYNTRVMGKRAALVTAAIAQRLTRSAKDRWLYHFKKNQNQTPFLFNVFYLGPWVCTLHGSGFVGVGLAQPTATTEHPEE